MIVVFTDVSVFFDLYKLQILPEFFELNWDIHTSDFVYNEIIHEDQLDAFSVFVECQKLHVIKISSEETLLIEKMKLKRSNKSFPDRTVLWKAKQENCILLTCDKALREEANHQKIEVHGSIWVVNQLIENNKISIYKGISLLEKLKNVNSRLPFSKIDRLINDLKQKTEANGM